MLVDQVVSCVLHHISDIRIVDRRQRYKKFEYLVEYKGYPLAVDYEWRPEAELQSTAPRLLKDFINLYESRKTA